MRIESTSPFLKLMVAISLILNLSGCSIVFPVIAPFKDIPAPTGPFAVGTRSACLVDSLREEFFTPEKDSRRLVTQIWYPISKQTVAAHRPYIEYPEYRIPALAKQLGLPPAVIKHIGRVTSNSSKGIAPLSSTQGFPVILFSHGLGGMRFQNTALLEDLASHGYVVIAVDHSYDANVAIFQPGDIAEYKAGKKRVLTANQLALLDRRQLDYRVADLRFILDYLATPYASALFSDIHLNLDRVGLLGHSLGGTTILTTMVQDDRIDAAMVLDGWYEPLPDSIIQSGLRKPVMHLGQLRWSQPLNYLRMDSLFARNTGPSYKVLIPNTLHTDFTDMPLFSPFSYLIGYTGSQDPEHILMMTRKTTRVFFDTWLKDQPVEKLEHQLSTQADVFIYIFTPL